MTKEAEANYSQLVSVCCDAFIKLSHSDFICSNCKEVVLKLTDLPSNTGLKVHSKFNNTGATNIVIPDQQEYYLSVLKRFSGDPTYELTSKKCEKCESLCRYTKDLQGNIIYICSNTKCRNIMR